MKKFIFSITLLTVMATQIKAESLFEMAWETVKATASGAKKSAKALVYGTPEATAEPETMQMETAKKVMSPSMAQKSQKPYTQQHPKETTTADHQVAL